MVGFNFNLWGYFSRLWTVDFKDPSQLSTVLALCSVLFVVFGWILYQICFRLLTTKEDIERKEFTDKVLKWYRQEKAKQQ